MEEVFFQPVYTDFLNFSGNLFYKCYGKCRKGVNESDIKYTGKRIVNNWVFNLTTLAAITAIFCLFLTGASFFLIKGGLVFAAWYLIRFAAEYEESEILSKVSRNGFFKENKNFEVELAVTIKEEKKFIGHLFKPVLTFSAP